MTTLQNYFVTAYIGLGSNLGDRNQTIHKAANLLRQASGVSHVVLSDLYETASVGGPLDQSHYLNAAAKVQCSLSASHLLEQMMRIEQQLGRERIHRWGARTIDLDLLFYENQVIREENLFVPHPRVQNRHFVLKPLLELAPDLVHPVFQKTVRQMEEELRQNPPVVRRIAVSGIIGVGKTTLARNLHQILGGTLLCEEYDKNPFLPRQLRGEHQAALASELFFLFSRTRQLLKDQYAPDQTVISDYVFDKNRLFARMNLDEDQFRMYQDIESVVLSELIQPDLLIYMTDTVENCLSRIRARGRSFEQRISPGWLTRLKQAYDEMVNHWSQGTVIIVDCARYDVRQQDVVQKIIQHMVLKPDESIHRHLTTRQG